jgi:fibronectin type 3 domain-containing protein
VPLPVGLPPAGLTATPKAEGVTLAWTAPEKSVTGDVAPIVTGYNIYRNAPGSDPGDLATPINGAPVKGTTYTDAPEYGDHEYRVVAVAAAGPPSLQSDFSAAVKVTFRDLVPPPTPASITPLIETKAVRLIWDPVEAADLAGYRLYRSEGVGHENSIRDIGTVPLVAQPVTTPDYVDKGANPGIAYKYAVTSVDKNGNESAKVWTGWVVVPKTP